MFLCSPAMDGIASAYFLENPTLAGSGHHFTVAGPDEGAEVFSGSFVR